jgi:dTDP-4-amino-4,6-dideoxygalactose transaminase
MNSRLDEIHAAMLSERLSWLSEFTERRVAIAAAYRDGIRHNDVTQLAAPEHDTAHVYHLYVVKCRKREALQAHLQANGVQSLIHYPIPIHMQEPCKEMKRDQMGLTQSDLYVKECLSLPCHPQMTDDDVRFVINSVNSFKG